MSQGLSYWDVLRKKYRILPELTNKSKKINAWIAMI
jgi:hypothetical protein